MDDKPHCVNASHLTLIDKSGQYLHLLLRKIIARSVFTTKKELLPDSVVNQTTEDLRI